MVGAEYLLMYFRAGKAAVEPLGAEEIVDAPARVPLARFEAVAPPAVLSLDVGIEISECISKARGEQLGHLVSLFVREAGVLAVRLGVL